MGFLEMRGKLAIAAGVLCGSILAFCLAISLRPSTYVVQRSATISAPPNIVFAQINDLRAWDAWSPWSKLDPNSKTTFSDPSAGKGASFSWDGNDRIGAGTMTILESKPDEIVAIDQEFTRPFAGKSRVAFVLRPEGMGTVVQWKMDGVNDFIGKAICMFMDMDAMVGKDFEQGLANLKAVTEQQAASQNPTTTEAAQEGPGQ